jgi:hypothetical protein
MLAYMDNVLDPADAETLGTKIKESDFASGLVQRIRTICRKVRMGAPRVDAKGLAQDANSVSEYLDSALPQDRIGDFERTCLESDVHLAEVAASHQILTMVLGKPADVPENLRERIYALGNGTQVPALPSAGGTEVASDKTARGKEATANGKAAGTKEKNSAEKVAAAPKVPDYLRAGQRTRIWPFVATLAAAALLAVLGLRAMGPFDSSHPVLRMFGGSQPVAAVPADVPATPNETTPPVAPPATDEGTNSAERNKTADAANASEASPAIPDNPPIIGDFPPEPTGEKPALPMPNPADVAASATPAVGVPAQPAPATIPPTVPPPTAVASATVPSTIPPAVPPTVPPATVPPSSVAPSTPAISAEPVDVGQYVSDQQILAQWDKAKNVWYRMDPRSVLLSGVPLVVLPTYRPLLALPSGAQVTFVGESGLQMERPTKDGTSAMKIDYGRCVIVTSGAAGAQLELNLAGLVGTATLGDADSSLAIDVRHWLPPGANPDTDPLVRIVEIFCTRGKVTWHQVGKEPVTIPASHVRIYDGKEDGETRGAYKAPEWIDARSFIGIDRDASAALEQAIPRGRPLNVALEELAQDRRVEVQALAVRGLGSLEQYESLLKMLSNEKQYSYWTTEIDALRLALTRGPQVSAQIRDTLQRIRPADADRLYQLLWTPSNEQLAGGEAARLVKNLEDPEMDVRVLTFDALRRITGAILLYRPEKRPEGNKVPIQKWKERLNEGSIVYKTPPSPLTDFKPLEKPAAAAGGELLDR